MNLFDGNSFQAFEYHSLEGRMREIQTYIQPAFQDAAEVIRDEIERLEGSVLPIHIAKHIRRTTNPPEQTWVGIGGNNRGYKRFPHFEITIYEDDIFVCLALIDQPDYWPEMIDAISQRQEQIRDLPTDYVISPHHTQNDKYALTEKSLDDILTKAKRIKKGEFMIGRNLEAGDKRLHNEADWQVFLRETVNAVYPLYHLCQQIRADQRVSVKE